MRILKFLFQKNHLRYMAKASLAVVAMVAFSCQLTPSLDDDQSIKPATSTDPVAATAKPEAVGDPRLALIRLHFTSTPSFVGSLRAEIRDANGTTVLGTSTIDYVLGGPTPSGWTVFNFQNGGIELQHGLKYKIFLTRDGIPGTGDVYWTGLSNPGDWYVQGQSSAGTGDFNFITNEITGFRDQLCFGGDVGQKLVYGQNLWQEFMPLDERVVLSTVNLQLTCNINTTENVFVDIQDPNGTIIGTSLPSQASWSSSWINFQFPNPLILERWKTYRILPRRSSPPTTAWDNIVWRHGFFTNPYVYGNSSAGVGVDYAFATDGNGFPDQQQLDIKGRYYVAPLPHSQAGVPWQEFRPTAH